MAVLLAVVVLVVLAALGCYAVFLRREPGDDTDRFHHAQQITSSWSQTYDGAAVREEPEATEGRPELQHSVHLVDA